MRKLACAAGLALLVLPACQGNPRNADGPSLADHKFTPETMTIQAGEVVRWVNDTEEAHTVTAVEGSLPDGVDYFSSGGARSEEQANDELGRELIDPGEEFEWTFEEPGSYSYYCIPHKDDGMVGTVVVE